MSCQDCEAWSGRPGPGWTKQSRSGRGEVEIPVRDTLHGLNHTRENQNIMRLQRKLCLVVCVTALFFGLCAATAMAQTAFPTPEQGDYIIKDFHFRSGETLPELKLHYRTIGKPVRDSSGVARNAVLILHGTGGAGTQFLSQQFAGVLFGPGQLLDATRYFIILPDAIGHGGSSKPSDGLHARFPHYTYDDMV